MLRAAKIIRHQKVIDLLYDNRKNEEYRFKSFRHSLLVVLLSIAAMVAGGDFAWADASDTNQ